MRLKELRKREHISQLELSKALNVSRSTVAMWEQGTNPDPEMLKNIAVVFQVSVDYLLGREEAQTKNAPAPDPEAEARERLVSLMMDYTPEEIQRIMDFAAGIKAARR